MNPGWPLILAPLLGVVVVLAATRFGPGASGDSSSYLMGAQNILAGHGFYRFSGGYELKPITGFPPGFSVALAGVGLLVRDLFNGSRLMNAGLMGVNLLLAGWLVHRYTRSWLAGLVGQVLILSSTTQVNMHAWVMSEPLYISLSLVFLVCLTVYLDRGGLLVLVLGGATAAAGILTRYAGLSMTAAGALAILALGASVPIKRLRDARLFAVVSLVPFLLWTERNAALAGTRVDRQLGYHALDPGLIRLFLADLSSWFVPHEIPLPTAARAGLAIIIALGVAAPFAFFAARSWVAWRREAWRFDLNRPGWGGGLPWLIMLYLAAYAAVLAANSLFLDASTTSTAPARYLAPVYVASVILLVCAGHDLMASWGWSQLGRFTAAFYLLILLGYNAWDLSAMLVDPFPSLGYTARRVTWAPTVSAIRAYEARGPLVSNNPEMVYILTGVPAYVRPISYDQYQEQARADYQQQLEYTKAVMQRGSVFVVFEQAEADDTRLIQFAGLVEIDETPHASFYALPSGP